MTGVARIAILAAMLAAATAASAQAAARTGETSIDRGQPASTLTPTRSPIIENVGQFDVRARFQARGSGGTVWFADRAIWITALAAGRVAERGRAAQVEGVNL